MSELIFWPLRLREAHLIHALHSLAASMLATRGATLLLVLDDSRHDNKTAAKLVADRFGSAVRSWLEPFGIENSLDVQTIHEIIDAPGEDEGSAEIWRTAQEYLRHPESRFWNIAKAAKVVPDFAAPDEVVRSLTHGNAWRLTDPPRVWTAYRKVIDDRSHERYISLGSKDEEPLWSEYDRVFPDTRTGHLFAPHLRLQATSVWTVEWLGYHSSMQRAGLVDEVTRRFSQPGESAVFLEWFVHVGFLLRECKAGRASTSESFEDLLDEVKRDQVALRDLTEEVGTWFFTS